MGSGKKAPKAPAIPKAPDPSDSFIKDSDGNVIAQNHYDKATNSWTQQTFLSPAQKQAQEQANTLTSKAMNQLINPNGADSYLNDWSAAYVQKNSQPIKDTARQARNAAINSYNSKGVLGASGASDYINQNIDKTEAQGLQDVQNEATLNKEQIKQNYTNNLMNQATLGSNGSNNVNNQFMSLGQFANSNGAYGNSVASQNYQNQLNGIMSRFNAQMQSYNAGNQGNSWLGPSIGAAGSIAAAAIPFMM